MIRIGIYGYGNLGRGVERSVAQNEDMELIGAFSRRPPESVKTATNVPVYAADKVLDFVDKIDVMILCGGSATDLPAQTPRLAESFNVVDSFDTHAKIPEHWKNVDGQAKKGGKVAVISAGWDPGMFSLARLYSSAILVDGKEYTFWGKGVSQGHSDAVRRIEGVQDARQYTIPNPQAVAAVRSGQMPALSTSDKHERECFVVAKEGADKAKIEREIKTMPNYFADYTTTVHFITQEELDREHKGLPHGGSVIRSGKTGGGYTHVIEYSLRLESNPEFTSCVLTACARAAYRIQKEGGSGCKTMLDIPPAYLSANPREELIKTLL